MARPGTERWLEGFGESFPVLVAFSPLPPFLPLNVTLTLAP